MRLKIELSPTQNQIYNTIDKHSIQGFIYSNLLNTEFKEIHNKPTFKFFTFSDIFPPRDFKVGNKYNLIISSPNEDFISVLYENISNHNTINLRGSIFTIENLKKFDLRDSNRFITGSPIVLYENKEKNEYFKFYDKGGFLQFFERLRDNAVKKYEVFYNEGAPKIDFIFDEVVPRVRNEKFDVHVKLTKQGKDFFIIGSLWKELYKKRIKKNERKFYKFIMDCGLGEKNSLGFGFINPLRRTQR